jgi:hypothetical protein
MNQAPILSIDDYLEKQFNETQVPGTMGFYEFLETKRGIPRTFFPKEAWLFLALQAEISIYAAFINGTVKKLQQEEAEKTAKGLYDKELKEASMEQLMMHIVSLKNQITKAEAELAKAAEQRAEEPAKL